LAFMNLACNYSIRQKMTLLRILYRLCIHF